MFKFWLDITKPEEAELAEYVKELKQEYAYTRTIRQGLTLMRDLRRGRTEILLQLFPHIQEELTKTTNSPPPEKLTEDLENYFNRLESLLAQQQSTPSPLPELATRLPTKTKQTEESNLLEIKQASANADNNPNWNLIISSAASVYGNFDSLPTEIIEYGIRTGRIPPDKVKTKPKSQPKKMDVPQFEPPSFDDLDI